MRYPDRHLPSEILDPPLLTFCFENTQKIAFTFGVTQLNIKHSWETVAQFQEMLGHVHRLTCLYLLINRGKQIGVPVLSRDA